MSSVSIVMPLMGLVPMVAMALAATGAKKKEITMTTAVPIRAGMMAFVIPMPKLKKRIVAIVKTARPTATKEPGTLRSVRPGALISAEPLFLRAFMLLTIERIMLGRLDKTPSMPAPAIHPTPIIRT